MNVDRGAAMLCILLMQSCMIASVHSETFPPGELDETILRIDESTLRGLAISQISPQLLQNSPRDPSVSVADVTFTGKGALVSVKILEAASPSIAQAMEQALRQWRILPVAQFSNRRILPGLVTGKVTYYFVPEAKGVRVYPPSWKGSIVSRSSERVDEARRNSQ